MNRHPLRVLVVDDNESVRRSVCQLLESQSDIKVVGEAVDGVDAVCKTREHRPDVVLLDITMPSMNGLEAAQTLQQEFPLTQIIILSQHESRGFRWGALAAGASGYVVKSNAAQDLIPELQRIQSMRNPA